MKKEILNEQDNMDAPVLETEQKPCKKKGRGKIILFGFLFFLTVATFSLAVWYKITFNVKVHKSVCQGLGHLISNRLIRNPITSRDYYTVIG